MHRLALALAAALSMQLLQIAVAADMPTKAPVSAAPIVAVPYNWTGVYVGGHVGGARDSVDVTAFVVPPFGAPFESTNISGILGGIQAGLNYQIGGLVLGVEGEFSWTDLDGDSHLPAVPASFFKVDVNNIATIAGRVGWAFDRALVYAKGGGAWLDADYGRGNTNATPQIFGTASEKRWGWLVGGGLEYGFTPNWSAKIEYNYLDFGTDAVVINCACIPATFSTEFTHRVQTVKFGVNYKFGWAPAAYAK